MAYIGRQPTVGNFRICDAISVVNGQAAYTMQVGGVNVVPESANNMIVSLNGVIQKPGSSYTISSSTITFSSNLSTGDVIDFIQILGGVANIGTPSDGTVSTAKIVDVNVTTAKIADANVTAAKMFSGFANGITMADEFRLTTNFSGSKNPIDANLERVDTGGQGQFGSLMGESSGIFTFPSTGYYLVVFNTEHYLNGDDREINGRIKVTTNGSSYTDVSRGAAHINGTGSNTHTGTNCFAIIDVTNTTNVKVAFRITVDNSSTNTISDTNTNTTSMRFIRLGDT